MYQECTYNPEIDKGPVIEGLALNMSDVVQHHEIKDTLDEDMFNGIDNVREVGCLVNDVFDAIMLERHYRSFSKSSQEDDPNEQK